MNFLKKFVKNLVHPLVWEELAQSRQEFRYTRRKYHCEKDLLPIFREYLSFDNGFYVDIGANDGRAFSNTYHLEKSFNWSGVLVEPIMHVYFRSREIRDLERNAFHCCALVDENYEHELVEMTFAGLMSVASGEVSDFEPSEWAELGAPFLGRHEHVQKTWSRARTLRFILETSKAPKEIDFLSIDAEGSEFSIMKNFDFELFVFRYILIEAKLDSPVHKLLVDRGFILISQIHQNLFFKNGKSN